MVVNCEFLRVIKIMDEERTGSESRRPAKLRDKSIGRVSRVYAHSKSKGVLTDNKRKRIEFSDHVN